MNHSDFSNQVQRLVDRQLSAQERAELLRESEQDPDRYREIALAFVEVQVLNEHLAQITPWVRDDAMRKPASIVADNFERATRNSSRIAVPQIDSKRVKDSSRLVNVRKGDPGTTHLNGSKHPVSTSKNGRTLTDSESVAGGAKTFWIAIAAALALAIPASLTGYWLGDSHRSTANRARVAEVQADSESVIGGGQAIQDASDGGRASATNDASTSPVRNRDQIVGPSSGELANTISTSVPERVRMQLLRSGFVLGEETQVVKVKLDEGRVVDVPITQLKVNYLGNRIYQ